MNISYRLADSDDVDALTEFWSENSGWDVIDSAEWKRRFASSPYGNSVVSVATDEETKKIIGQFIFIPVRIAVNGKEIKGYRPFAPILHQSLQTKFGIASLLTGQHPILKLYKKVADEMTKQGVSLIYMVPDPRWARILQAFPFMNTHKFPLWSYPLPLQEKIILPAGITVDKIKPSDPAIDQLWDQSSSVYSAAIVRNCKTMSWKILHGDYRIYAIRRDGEITGLFTTIYQMKDDQWLICDLVTRDKEESLSITLAAACNIIQEENNKLPSTPNHPNKIALLSTPAIEQVVKKMGFRQEDYHFTLAVHLLNEDGFDRGNISPEKWYVSAKD